MSTLELALGVAMSLLWVVSIAVWAARLVAGRFGAGGRAMRIRHWEYLLDAVLGLLVAVWFVRYVRDAPEVWKALGWAAVALLCVGLACWNLRRWEAT